jgi:2-oxo-4-hydroxy-4-carboxy-5-ureidoimidazoline decarboxylase
MADASGTNEVLARWNSLDAAEAALEALPCNGSHVWAERLAARRPMIDAAEVIAVSNDVWLTLSDDDWQEAFDSHPRIGERHAQAATATSLKSSAQEQNGAMSANDVTRATLIEGNRRYEAKFGRIFLVRASGRSATEILEILESRMANDTTTELYEAAEQQRQITELRLQRWLGEE